MLLVQCAEPSASASPSASAQHNMSTAFCLSTASMSGTALPCGQISMPSPLSRSASRRSVCASFLAKFSSLFPCAHSSRQLSRHPSIFCPAIFCGAVQPLLQGALDRVTRRAENRLLPEKYGHVNSCHSQMALDGVPKKALPQSPCRDASHEADSEAGGHGSAGIRRARHPLSCPACGSSWPRPDGGPCGASPSRRPCLRRGFHHPSSSLHPEPASPPRQC